MATKKTNDGKVVIPEDLSVLSDTELSELNATAVAAFQALLPEDGTAPAEDALNALSVLAEGIEGIKGETGKREAAALARKEQVEALQARVVPTPADGTPADAADADADAEAAKDKEPETVTAGGRRPLRRRVRPAINIDVAGLAKRDIAPEPEDDKPKHVGFAAQGAAGFEVGKPLTTFDMAVSINSRLAGFNTAVYQQAARSGNQQTERFTIARLPREFPEELIVHSEDPRGAIKAAVDQSRLQGGSLTASGGWGAPSETLYELIDISEAANLVSVPEIQVNRGGVRHAIGPQYSNIFSNTGFCYTEAEDIGGLYVEGTPNTAGSKPVYDVPTPSFTDVRLGYCGVSITAGLMQQRGYPESIETTIGVVLNAHMHRVSASVINDMVAASTAITWGAANMAGATAPLLTAIDLQAAHLRASNRMADTAVLEVVLPTWTKQMIRSDLARRLGVDLLSVSDSRIAGWFTDRNINAQYVVDWQDIAATAAASFTAPPTSVKFLLYPAGSFIKGVTDSITFENIYDSTLLQKNDYTALFTEDPYLVLKRVNDTRVVTVAVEASGATHIGEQIAPNGTYTP